MNNLNAGVNVDHNKHFEKTDSNTEYKEFLYVEVIFIVCLTKSVFFMELCGGTNHKNAHLKIVQTKSAAVVIYEDLATV